MIAVSSAIIMLACQTLSNPTLIPSAIAPPKIDRPTAASPTMTIETQPAIKPSPIAIMTSGGNELPETLVYLLEDHSLVFMRNGETDMTATMAGGFSSWLDLNAAAKRMTIVQNAVYVPILKPEHAIRGELGIFSINADGAEQFFSVPAEYATGASLVDVLPSADGEWFAWLLDTTKIPPSLTSDQVCEASAGCIGREYLLLVSSRSGGEIVMQYPLVLGDPYPFLLIDSWQEDSSAIFLRRVPWMVASPLYQAEGGGIYEISVPAANLVERGDDYLNSESHASPNGAWMVDEAVGEGEWILVAASSAGATLVVPPPASGYHLTQESTFSPSSEYIVWLELQVNNEDWSTVQGIEIRRMDLSNGEVKTLTTIIGPISSEELPFTGPWLSGNLLVIHEIHQNRVLDTNTGDWIALPPPQALASWAVVGGIGQ